MDTSPLEQLTGSGGLQINAAKIVSVLLVIAIAYAVTTIIRLLLDFGANRFPSHRLLFKRVQPLLRIGVYGVAIYYSIVIIAPEQNTLLALLGSIALALGLAAKDLLNDLIGGIVVLFDRSFQIGDRVTVGSYYGEVVAIGLRSTKLQTTDDSLVTVPNSTLLTSGVSNTNAGNLDCQVVVDIYLPARTDLKEIEDVAHEAVLTSRLAYLKKPVVVNVKDKFEETHLTHLVVKAYVFDTRYENDLAADLTRRIKKELSRRKLIPSDVRFTDVVGD